MSMLYYSLCFEDDKYIYFDKSNNINYFNQVYLAWESLKNMNMSIVAMYIECILWRFWALSAGKTSKCPPQIQVLRIKKF